MIIASVSIVTGQNVDRSNLLTNPSTTANHCVFASTKGMPSGMYRHRAKLIANAYGTIATRPKTFAFRTCQRNYDALNAVASSPALPRTRLRDREAVVALQLCSCCSCERLAFRRLNSQRPRS
jgi:hypothetical protein